jgi:DNA (cytosine-5)-methyltransferase 1
MSSTSAFGNEEPATVIDLFCGAGGLSLGFQQAGFHVLAGIDIDKYSGETFTESHPGAMFFNAPIENIDASRIRKTLKIKKGALDVLIGGPPCQGFSVYNHGRGTSDPRTKLPFHYLRIVEGLAPKWIVMENVTGMLSIADAVESFVREMARIGYRVEHKILKAEEYGVPQERRRIVFIGNRINREIYWPRATHGKAAKPFVSIADALSDLPVINNGEDASGLPYRFKPKSELQRVLRCGVKTVRNHAAPKLSAINLERMKHIRQGGSWRDIPLQLLPEGMKRAKRSDHTKRYGRMSPEGLACTILTKCDIHWGQFIHPHEDRAISVREAARLQTFPDTVVFRGPRTEQYRQVGNAVPPVLARIIAESIQHSHLSGDGRDVLRFQKHESQRSLDFDHKADRNYRRGRREICG